MTDKENRGSTSSSSDAQKPSTTPGSATRGSSNKQHTQKEARNAPDQSDVINNNSKPCKETRAPGGEKSDRDPGRNSAERTNKENNKDKKNNSAANNIGNNNSKGNNMSSTTGSGSKQFLNKRSADNFLDKAAGSDPRPMEALPSDGPITSLPAATGTGNEAKHSGRTGSGRSTSAESSDSGQEGSAERQRSGKTAAEKNNKHPGLCFFYF